MMSSESRLEAEVSDPVSITRETLFSDPQEVLLSMRDILGRKWHPVIVYYLLSDGPLGFSALKDRVSGISSKMLSQSLDDLEAAGLVTRELLSDQPIRVEYSLTDRGQSLEPLVTEMVRWGDEHADVFETDDGEEESTETTSVPETRRAAWGGQ